MRTQATLVVGLRRIIVMLIDGVCVAFQLYLSFLFSSFTFSKRSIFDWKWKERDHRGCLCVIFFFNGT